MDDGGSATGKAIYDSLVGQTTADESFVQQPLTGASDKRLHGIGSRKMIRKIDFDCERQSLVHPSE